MGVHEKTASPVREGGDGQASDQPCRRRGADRSASRRTISARGVVRRGRGDRSRVIGGSCQRWATEEKNRGGRGEWQGHLSGRWKSPGRAPPRNPARTSFPGEIQKRAGSAGEEEAGEEEAGEEE